MGFVLVESVRWQLHADWNCWYTSFCSQVFVKIQKIIITVGVEILFVNKKKNFLKKVGLGQNFLKTILYEPQVF